ncbi:MAG TPA: hypothetical protein VMO26_08440 [Vicinamibacterales bacterium]|nr:hypothetical protein [Vicinamibacterales bacterium]
MSDDAERWRRLQDLVQSALDRPVDERAAFLAAACRGDDDLRREAASLLERESRADGFLADPLDALAAAEHSRGPALVIGQTIAHYRIVKAIGAGGMGEIYLAEDTRLERQVASRSCRPSWPWTPRVAADSHGKPKPSRRSITPTS